MRSRSRAGIGQPLTVAAARLSRTSGRKELAYGPLFNALKSLQKHCVHREPFAPPASVFRFSGAPENTITKIQKNDLF